jgi:DNA-binding LytR/AlgR family response regulator
MKQIRAIIADDEETLRVYLKEKLAAAWPDLTITGEAGDGETALRLVEEQRPDVAFLDIKMPGISGIEVARRIAGSCAVVFITAHNKYAVEAFEGEALDYVLKPVTDERLEKTVKRIKERLASPRPAPEVAAVIEKVASVLEKSPHHLQWIKAQHKDGVRLIPVADVYFFRATDKYTVVRSRDGEHLIRKTIKELENELDPDQFWRVHRAAIVNARAIHVVDHSLSGGYTVKFKDIPDQLTVSRAYAHLFKQM